MEESEKEEDEEESGNDKDEEEESDNNEEEGKDDSEKQDTYNDDRVGRKRTNKRKMTRIENPTERYVNLFIISYDYIDYKLVGLMNVVMATNLQSISIYILYPYFCINTYNDYKM